jgi:hypothetical protein
MRMRAGIQALADAKCYGAEMIEQHEGADSGRIGKYAPQLEAIGSVLISWSWVQFLRIETANCRAAPPRLNPPAMDPS